MLVALVPVSVLPVGASGHVAACSCCSKCWWLAPCRLAATQNAGFVDTGSITAVMMERCVPPVSPFLSPHGHFWHVGLLPSPGYQQHHWASSKPTGGANPGPPPPSGRRRPPLFFVSPPRISLLPSQMLQLRRAGPPRQRVQAAAAAQEMPLLPEHQPHGRQLPGESAAVPQLAGKACLLPRGGGHAQLAPAPRNPGMMAGGGGGYHRDGEALARQRAATGARRRERGGEAAAPFPPRSPLLIGVAPKMVGGALGAPLAGEKGTRLLRLYSPRSQVRGSPGGGAERQHLREALAAPCSPCPVPGGGRDEGGRAGGHPRAGPAAPPAPRSQVSPLPNPGAGQREGCEGCKCLSQLPGFCWWCFPWGNATQPGLLHIGSSTWSKPTQGMNTPPAHAVCQKPMAPGLSLPRDRGKRGPGCQRLPSSLPAAPRPCLYLLAPVTMNFIILFSRGRPPPARAEANAK